MIGRSIVALYNKFALCQSHAKHCADVKILLMLAGALLQGCLLLPHSLGARSMQTYALTLLAFHNQVRRVLPPLNLEIFCLLMCV